MTPGASIQHGHAQQRGAGGDKTAAVADQRAVLDCAGKGEAAGRIEFAYVERAATQIERAAKQDGAMHRAKLRQAETVVELNEARVERAGVAERGDTGGDVERRAQRNRSDIGQGGGGDRRLGLRRSERDGAGIGEAGAGHVHRRTLADDRAGVGEGRRSLHQPRGIGGVEGEGDGVREPALIDCEALLLIRNGGGVEGNRPAIDETRRVDRERGIGGGKVRDDQAGVDEAAGAAQRQAGDAGRHLGLVRGIVGAGEQAGCAAQCHGGPTCRVQLDRRAGEG